MLIIDSYTIHPRQSWTCYGDLDQVDVACYSQTDLLQDKVAVVQTGSLRALDVTLGGITPFLKEQVCSFRVFLDPC